VYPPKKRKKTPRWAWGQKKGGYTIKRKGYYRKKKPSLQRTGLLRKKCITVLEGSKGPVLGGLKREQPVVTKEDDRGSIGEQGEDKDRGREI